MRRLVDRRHAAGHSALARNLGRIAGLASAVAVSLTTAASLVAPTWTGLGFDMTVRPAVLGYADSGALALAFMTLSQVASRMRARRES